MQLYHRFPLGQPLENMISQHTFEHIVKHQRFLDAEFLKVAIWQPLIEDRHSSLLDERGEFYNEFKSETKYWAKKPTDIAKILDEHSDILHFYIGWSLARYNANRSNVIRDWKVVEMYYEKIEHQYSHELQTHFNVNAHEKFRELLLNGKSAHNPFEVVAYATYVLSFYVSGDYIFKAYEAKKDENYKRIERTAKGMNDR